MTISKITLDKWLARGKSWSEKIKRHPKRILWFFILFYIILFSSFSLYKYLTYNYIGLDLAIYNQVFFNSSLGHFFNMTIHPHSYLGDHFEIIIMLFLPFYFILKSPATLLVLQTIVLALAAYPLYLIARKKLSEGLSLLIGLLYLANVFVQNTNMYEFHILPFAVPLLFLLYYFFIERKFGLFLLFLALTLLVREDAALVIFAFGFFALIEKKSWKWIITPIVLGLIWFILATKLTGYFSGYGTYKFIRYYGWLGNSQKEILLGFINHPWAVASHLFAGHNLAFLVGLFLPFAFLPLVRIKYLIPSLLIIFQILMLGSTGILALEIHYTSLIIPFLFIGLIYALDKILHWQNKNKLLVYLGKEKYVFLTVMVLIALYSTLYMGPAFFLTKDMFNIPKIKQEVTLRNDFVQQINNSQAVATGFQFIPRLSSREKIYSLHYQYLGKKQYSDFEYRIPNDVQVVLFDLNDFLYYHYLYHEYDENNIGGAQRIRELIDKNEFCLSQYIGKFLLYEKNCQSAKEAPYSILEEAPADMIKADKILADVFKYKGMNKNDLTTVSLNNHDYRVLPLSFYYESLKKTAYDYLMRIQLWQNNKIVWQENYPLSPFYPTHDWQPGEIVKNNYNFLIPQNLAPGDYQYKITFYSAEGEMGLSKDKIFRPFIHSQEQLGETDLLWIKL